MDLAMAGVSFRTAPVEFREKIAVRTGDMPAVLERLSAKCPGAELALISTCNRTELYVAAPGIAGNAGVLVDLLAPEADRSRFAVLTGAEAAEHLMSVASGLDSMVVGEAEVLGQVKQAYVKAVEAGKAGRVINALFHRAFRAAKRVHAETDIGRGRVSVSSVAVDFAEKIFDQLASKTVVVVGAGETAELTLKSLVDRGVRAVYVVNRSMDKARDLAARHGGEAVSLDHLEDCLPKADIVISSTGAPHCVIPAESVRRSVAGRHGRPLLLLDIAVPRDIEEGAAQLADVYLCNIDDLRKISDENILKRREAVGAAAKIVREEAREFAVSFTAAGLGPLMKEMDDRAGEIVRSELERAFAKMETANLSEPCKDEIRNTVRRTVNKLLAAPKKALNEAVRNGTWDEISRVAMRWFTSWKPQDEEEAGVEPSGALPLTGRTIGVTRPRTPAEELEMRLRLLGARVVSLPTVRIAPPEDEGPLHRALDGIAEFDWIVFASPNAVDRFFAALEGKGRGAGALSGRKICCVGPGTAERLAVHGLHPDLMPERFSSEGIREALAGGGLAKGRRFLLPRADIAPRDLPDGLRAAGADVTEVVAYRTVPERPGPDALESLRKGEVDIVTFTSSSTARNFADLVRREFNGSPAGLTYASIGPETSRTAREEGLAIVVEAREHSIDGLIAALVEHFAGNRAGGVKP